MIAPDGFAGALIAIESIDGVKVLLNGPAGCRNRFMVLMRQLMRDIDHDSERYNVPYFKGQGRVPCTYIDEQDFINGGYPKIRDALEVIRDVEDCHIVILDSPGASLIGDDHSKAITDAGMDERAFSISSHYMSDTFERSYDRTVATILKHMDLERIEPRRGKVNIIGYPVTDKDWLHGLGEIRSLLNKMGLEIGAVIGAGSSWDSIRDSMDAEANILIYPEFGRMTSEFLESEMSIPTIRAVAPIGFDSTREWIGVIASALDVDPGPAMDHLRSVMRDVTTAIASDKGRSKNLRGMTFDIEAIPSIAFPLTRWLIEYLGMVPSAIRFTSSDKGSEEHLRDYLEARGLSPVIGAPRLLYTDVVLTNGHDALNLEEERRCGVGIDISFPSVKEMPILPEPLIGPLGAMYIADRILNSI